MLLGDGNPFFAREYDFALGMTYKQFRWQISTCSDIIINGLMRASSMEDGAYAAGRKGKSKNR